MTFLFILGQIRHKWLNMPDSGISVFPTGAPTRSVSYDATPFLRKTSMSQFSIAVELLTCALFKEYRKPIGTRAI